MWTLAKRGGGPLKLGPDAAMRRAKTVDKAGGGVLGRVVNTERTVRTTGRGYTANPVQWLLLACPVRTLRFAVSGCCNPAG